MEGRLLQILLPPLLVKHISFFLILFPSYSVPLTIFTIGDCPPPKRHKLLEMGKSFVNQAREPGICFSHRSFGSSKGLT